MNNRIIQLRKANGLSQQDLAPILHISPSAEGMYEQGRRTPSLETLIAMSILFRVSLDYLITGTGFAEEYVHREKETLPPMLCCKCRCGKCGVAGCSVSSIRTK